MNIQPSSINYVYAFADIIGIGCSSIERLMIPPLHLIIMNRLAADDANVTRLIVDEHEKVPFKIRDIKIRNIT